MKKKRQIAVKNTNARNLKLDYKYIRAIILHLQQYIIIKKYIFYEI